MIVRLRLILQIYGSMITIKEWNLNKNLFHSLNIITIVI